MALFKKKILINISTPAGAFIKSLQNFNFDSFSKALNGGPSECVLETDMPFDYSGGELNLGNGVEVVIFDRDTASQTGGVASRIIYRGYISMIEREITGAFEKIRIRVLGYYTLLSLDVLKNSDQTTLYSNSTSGITATLGSQNAADIGLMVRGVIDRYRAETLNPKIYYDVDKIPLTSTTAIYTFQQKTYREALDTLKGMAPAGVFYYIDELGGVSFKTKPTTPTHKFIFKRHFHKVHVEHSLEKVRNFLLLWNGKQAGDSVYEHYQDDESLGKYGRRAERSSDYGIIDTTSADLLGARFIADNKKPDIRVTCTIVDNNEDESMGYDIESIQPGDTCSLYGFAPGFDDIFQDNMLITAVNYSLNSVEITVEIIKSSLLELQTKQDSAIKDIASGGLSIPTNYN